jgi:hypothetical protein
MTIFAQKLSTLVETVRLGASGPIHAMAAAMAQSAGRQVVSIGSGGSAIAAEYFARCRSTLTHGTTVVSTPMEYVLSREDQTDHDVWLFSAGASNPDAAGALQAALSSAAANIVLVTVNEGGLTAVRAAQSDRSTVIAVPVADPKDGFLATHSLVAMVTCLLAASESLADHGRQADVVEQLADAIETIPIADPAGGAFRPSDTVLVLHDPLCRTVATLIETSLWETAIAPVQRVDFRNFAHGRHVWAARHPERTFIVAFTSAASREIWGSIRDALPVTVRSASFDLGHSGRFRTALSIAEGLEMVRVIGDIAGVDPGRPGHGAFAETIYGDPGLERLAHRLDPSVRHKLAAVALRDDPFCGDETADSARAKWKVSLSRARIGGIVLDYDGTVVATDVRLAPPAKEVILELTRLADAGLAIGFATGRGGSAGTALRAALPRRLHSSMIIGYYNGGHIRPLNVDIDHDRPEEDREISSVADWIEAQELLKAGASLKRGSVQLSISHADLTSPATFRMSIESCPLVKRGAVKVLSSHHSFDLIPMGTSKSAVTAMIRAAAPHGAEVLAIGDSGEPGGNDAELLAQSPSISVDGVCGRLDGCWSLFGATASGPVALVRILRALRIDSGQARLDIESLTLNNE